MLQDLPRKDCSYSDRQYSLLLRNQKAYSPFNRSQPMGPNVELIESSTPNQICFPRARFNIISYTMFVIPSCQPRLILFDLTPLIMSLLL